MEYAIIENTAGGTPIVKSTGSIQELFPNTSFTASGPNTNFLAENSVVELVKTLSYTSPTQKLVSVEPYIDSGKVYTVKVESTTTDEQAALTNTQWQLVRTERNVLLERTDWRAGSDLTISDEWKTYRQALRDVPTQSDPFNITWPTEPVV
tara:strand:+ start:1529 stop:1981 length:453 start_codon:yes stop_codon:yes gene_type:complete